MSMFSTGQSLPLLHTFTIIICMLLVFFLSVTQQREQVKMSQGYWEVLTQLPKSVFRKYTMHPATV